MKIDIIIDEGVRDDLFIIKYGTRKCNEFN